MSTDEYSEDIPDDMFMHRAPSAGSTSYPNLGSSSSCSMPPAVTDMVNMQITQESLQDQQLIDQRQKRKYIRRKNLDDRKKRNPRTKDINAPRMPLNGYVRFLNANRERTKQENPTLSFADVTKKLASEWSSMTNDEKKAYLDEAEKAKEVYLKQLHEYQRSESYQEFIEMKQRVKHQQQQNLINNNHNSEMNIESSLPPMKQQHINHFPQSSSSSSSAAHHGMYSSGHNHHRSQFFPPNTSHYSPPIYAQSQQQPQQPSPYVSYNMNGNSNIHSRYNGPCSSGSNGLAPHLPTYPGYYANSGTRYMNPMVTNSNHFQNRVRANYSNSMGNPVFFNDFNRYQIGPPNVNNLINSNEPIPNVREPNPSSSLVKMLDKCGSSVVDLPIFTEEFLEHNKMREQELRQFRALTMEYEEAIAISSKHIEEMNKASDQLLNDEQNERQIHERLTMILNQLQRTLVEKFRDITIPKDLIQSTSSDFISDVSTNDNEEDDFSPSTKSGTLNLKNFENFMNSLDMIRSIPAFVSSQKSSLPSSSSMFSEHSFVQNIRSIISSLEEIQF